MNEITWRDWAMGAARSRTMWFSLALAVLGALEQHSELLRPLLADHYGVVMFGVAVVVAVLRVVTTTPLELR